MYEKGGETMFTFALPEQFEKEVSISLRNVYADAIEQARRDACISKEYLTAKEVGTNYVSVSVATLRDWENQGLPCYQIQSKKYYKKNEIDAFMNKYKR